MKIEEERVDGRTWLTRWGQGDSLDKDRNEREEKSKRLNETIKKLEERLMEDKKEKEKEHKEAQGPVEKLEDVIKKEREERQEFLLTSFICLIPLNSFQIFASIPFQIFALIPFQTFALIPFQIFALNWINEVFASVHVFDLRIFASWRNDKLFASVRIFYF